MLLTKHSLPVIVDTAPRALVQCKPYKARLTIEACAKRAKAATMHHTATGLGGQHNLSTSACRQCPVGLNTIQVMRAHGLAVKTRMKRYGTLYPLEGM